LHSTGGITSDLASHFRKEISKVKKLGFLIVLVFALCLAGGAVAQTVVDTEVKSGTVIGKTDHSIIVKMSDGKVQEFQVPPGKTAMVDGKEVGLADLKIGTQLSATFHTIAKPVTVQTTTVREGEVVRVNGSTLIYKEGGKVKTVVVPSGYRFNVEGRGETAVNELTPGMKLNATVVTTSTKMTTEKKGAGATGMAPAEPKPAPVVAAPAPAPTAVAAAPAPPPPAEPAKKKLPKTATVLPLLALLGSASLATGLRLRRS
jgi:RNase P/RNase MRP subunit p29